TKLVCPVLSSKFANSQFCFVVISSSNHSKALPFIHSLKYPITTSLFVGKPPALFARFTP
ncbi:2579_t:CDS:1, partial [Cetraspora pellucida]